MTPAPSDSQFRTLPHSLEAEQAVLGTFFLNNAAVTDVQALLSPEDFYDPRHQTLFQVIIDLSEKSEPIDPLVLINEMGRRDALEKVGGADYIAGLEQSVISPGNVMHHAGIVHEKSRLRRLIHATVEISDEAYSEQDEAQELLKVAEQKIFEIIKERRSGGFESFSDVANDVWNDVLHRSENRQEVTGVTTGYRLLDHLTGGFQRSDLLILAARPSVGKTSLALNFAVNAASKPHTDVDGVPFNPGVAIFSLEMSSPQVIQRMICTRAQIPMELLRKNKMNRRQIERFHQVTQEMQDLPIFVLDTPGIDPTELRLQAQHLKIREPNLSLIIIDYLQLMSFKGSRSENRQQEVSEISRSLKALARDLDVPVLALSQLSRGIESRPRAQSEPRLADLRESGAIEQDADVVFFVHRLTNPRDQTPDTSSSAASVTETNLIIGKQRNGPLGKIPLLFRSDFTEFVEMAPEHSNQG